MTENTPDAVKVAREACAREEERIGMPGNPFREGKRDRAAAMLWATLGARGMQAAMPAPAGVRVKALEWVKPPQSDTLRKCETPIGTYRTWTHHEADGRWFWSLEFGATIAQGEGASEAEVQAAAQAHHSSLILSAIEDAGAREGAQSPVAVMVAALQAVEDEGVFVPEGAAEPLTMPVAHDPRFPSSGGTTKTIDGTLYNAPTPAGAGDLVERARAKAANMRLDDALSIGGAHDDGLLDALASRIEALEAEVAREKLRADAEAAEVNLLTHHRDVADREREHAENRATTAESERNAWRERESETQEALQKIGEEFGIHGGEPRVDGLLRVLREQRADLAALRAEVERKDARIAALMAAGERYLSSVAALGEQSGYNCLTYFETPILKAPTDAIGDECHRRWVELNDAGKALRAALAPAKAGG